MCKVDSLIDQYNLTVPDPMYESVDDYLAARWTGTDGRSPQGYKTLTEWFNKRVLKHIFEEHGRSTVSIHLDREYDVIVDGGDIQRAELAADLESDALDIDELQKTLVSTGTIRNHLNDCLAVEKEPQSKTEGSDWRMDDIQTAKQLANSKTRTVLPGLASTGKLPGADQAGITVEIKLSCPDCSTRVPIEDAIERGYICKAHLQTTDDTPERDDDDVGANAVEDWDVDTDGDGQTDSSLNFKPTARFSFTTRARYGLVRDITSALPASPLAIEAMPRNLV